MSSTGSKSRTMKKMIVISFDAVGRSDLPLLRSNPVFDSYFTEGAYCDNVSSVYPSVTYPAHTSIITGLLPKNHGVVNNTLLQPKRMSSPDWMWQQKYVKGVTLYDRLLARGLTVSSTFWPVTAGSRITYNLPEVLANRPWQNQITVSLTNGSALYEAELFAHFRNELNGISQPELDNFAMKSAIYTLKKYSPDLMLIHLTDADTTRHSFGLHGPKVDAALHRHTARLELIEQTLKEMGIFEDTVIAILGDHYQKDVTTVVNPNYYLKAAGYIDTDSKDRITDFRAICHEADGCAYIYIKDSRVTEDVRSLLEKISYIKHIYSAQEASSFGADSGCAFMIEAADSVYFQDDHDVPVKDISGLPADHGIMHATHGYHPDDDSYKTFFAIKGPGINPGAHVDSISLIDEGPTLAALWNADLGQTDGHVIRSFLK